MLARLPDKPDHAALELEILELWERERTFERLREANADGPRWSFVDGPVTANRMVLGVHTAWGRTLKDVFQRYKALRGYHQRYQNGFDCQGLWIEVGVERSLGLNSKREIEEFGLAEFARRCREVVVQSSRALTEGSIRLGQWMDWGRDYFTFSDTNIEYIWRFLRHVHEQGWLYLGHRSTEWCPRCGTSISAHELVGSYVDRADPSLYVRFPLLDRPGEALVDLDDDAVDAARERRGRRQARCRLRSPRGRRMGRGRPLPGRAVRRAEARRGARRLALRGPVRRSASRRGCRPPRDRLGRRHPRRRHGHRPHRAGRRLRGLRALARARPAGADAGGRVGSLLRRVRLAARALDGRGGRADHRLPRGAGPPRRGRPPRAPLSRVLALPHAADLPDLGRLVHRRRRPA